MITGAACFVPRAPIVPLTDNLQTLQTANSYKTAPVHSKTGGGQTFLHLGIAWGLRTLSPLWRDVWDTQSVSGEALPRTPVRAKWNNHWLLALGKEGHRDHIGWPKLVHPASARAVVRIV